MIVDPGRPACRARVNVDSPREYAGKRRKRKSGNDSLRVRRDGTPAKQVGVNVDRMSSSCGRWVAEMDALDKGGRGPESAALTARHRLPLSGISDYTSVSNENHWSARLATR